MKGRGTVTCRGCGLVARYTRPVTQEEALAILEAECPALEESGDLQAAGE